MRARTGEEMDVRAAPAELELRRRISPTICACVGARARERDSAVSWPRRDRESIAAHAHTHWPGTCKAEERTNTHAHTLSHEGREGEAEGNSSAHQKLLQTQQKHDIIIVTSPRVFEEVRGYPQW